MTSHHRMTLAPNGQSRAGGAHNGDYLSLNDYDFTSLILHVVIFPVQFWALCAHLPGSFKNIVFLLGSMGIINTHLSLK